MAKTKQVLVEIKTILTVLACMEINHDFVARHLMLTYT